MCMASRFGLGREFWSPVCWGIGRWSWSSVFGCRSSVFSRRSSVLGLRRRSSVVRLPSSVFRRPSSVLGLRASVVGRRSSVGVRFHFVPRSGYTALLSKSKAPLFAQTARETWGALYPSQNPRPLAKYARRTGQPDFGHEKTRPDGPRVLFLSIDIFYQFGGSEPERNWKIYLGCCVGVRGNWGDLGA